MGPERGRPYVEATEVMARIGQSSGQLAERQPGIHRLTGTRRGPGSIWAGCRETIPQQVLLPFLKPIQILFVQGHLAVTDNSCDGLTLSVNYVSPSGSYNEGSNSATPPHSDHNTGARKPAYPRTPGAKQSKPQESPVQLSRGLRIKRGTSYGVTPSPITGCLTTSAFAPASPSSSIPTPLTLILLMFG
jgi:hypothetical protein